MDRSKYQYEGMKWLVELELLNHPQVINTLKFNIFMASKSIKETELLIYRENKAMLVYLELSWFARKFKNKKKIFDEVHEVLSQLLPSFRLRVTDDPEIIKLAVKKVEQALTGGKNENSNNLGNGAIQQLGVTNPSETLDKADRPTEGNQPNPEEQPEVVETVSAEPSSDDSKNES